MVIFVTIAIAAFIVVAGGFLLGHDHDFDHSIDTDASYEAGVDSHGVIGIFSMRVIATFVMGFGAAGAVALYYGAGYPLASVIGVAAGVILAALMYGIMLLFIEQQASSVTPTDSLLGCTGTVTVPIDKDALGEIGVSLGGEYHTFTARAHDSGPLGKGSTVRIVAVSGSVLTVDKTES
ncbi:MAG: NfeD family protein [Sedimentisphaerales bacterium]|nr:NfeD family protein [Sedimentisphaerales bacterium]